MKPQPIQDSRWVGRVLRDKWRIDRRIARGGMGTVFVATHKNNGSTAAIKILHPEFSRDSDTRSRFLQEGYAANRVSHPGVVRILDDDVTEEGIAYLVMELLEGELLERRRIRKGGKLPLTEVYEIADQLLDVLASAHANGIVHRDVKPDNLFLTAEGRLKVLDFGFAQMKSSYRTEQTATGFLLGTPGFMAPEQATGNRRLIDAQTDLWAVGATMFILLTGQPCHAGESAAEMLVAAASVPVRSITTLEPHLPTKLAQAIDRALAFEKSARWPDARSMQSALRAVAEGARVLDAPSRRSLPDTARSALATTARMGAGPEGAPAGASRDAGRSPDVDEDPPPPGVPVDEPTSCSDPVDAFEPTLASFAPLEPEHMDVTVVMASRPAHPGDLVRQSPAAGAIAPRASRPDGHVPVDASSHLLARNDPHPGEARPSPTPLVARAARPRSRRAGLRRALAFVLVAGITMVVVIFTGLLVILGSE